jgi:hypothetical protein
MTGKGHEDQFAGMRASYRYRCGEATFARTHSNGRDASRPAIREVVTARADRAGGSPPIRGRLARRRWRASVACARKLVHPNSASAIEAGLAAAIRVTSHPA